ncbi:MAG: LD-carboxypeptidase [Deltaproteobacteria bacterium]|nr:MAG: LD-carboxypeptidase [Deltaproteobacteria bacterium]
MPRPAALRPGDGIAVVAPASPFDKERFERGVRALQDIGLEPRFGKGVFERHQGYLAGDDKRRLEELRHALQDSSIKALVLARGGYGLQRIVSEVPADFVEKSAKPVVGYSDATVLHELWWRAKMPSVHGPMCTQLADDATALARLRALLYGAVPEPLRWTARTVRPGRAEGPLRGGNLAVLASLCGTPLQPSFREAIVLLEDLNEPPYRLDRLCTQLLLSGAFEGAVGFVVGDLAAEGEENDGRDEAVGERLATLGVPVVLGGPFGHAGRNQPVAFGIPHTLDADEGALVQIDPMLEKRGRV